jgi:hypothetical protein
MLYKDIVKRAVKKGQKNRFSIGQKNFAQTCICSLRINLSVARGCTVHMCYGMETGFALLHCRTTAPWLLFMYMYSVQSQL